MQYNNAIMGNYSRVPRCNQMLESEQWYKQTDGAKNRLSYTYISISRASRIASMDKARAMSCLLQASSTGDLVLCKAGSEKRSYNNSARSWSSDGKLRLSITTTTPLVGVVK